MRVSVQQFSCLVFCALLAVAVAPCTAQDPAPAPAPAPAAAATPAPAPAPAAAAPAAAPAPAPAALPTPVPTPPPGPDNPRQVRITAKILEWRHNSSIDLGFSILYTANTVDADGLPIDDVLKLFDMTFPQQSAVQQGLTLFLDGLNASDRGGFEVVIQALEQAGDVDMVCEPTVVVPCSKDLGAPQQAVVSTHEKIPYETAAPAGAVLASVTRFKDAATVLTVTAEDILQDDYIRMKIDTSVTDLSSYVSVALNENGDPLLVPQMATRRINNTVLVKDRALLVTGVLKTTTKYKNDQGVPWLARVPLLGYLFSNHLHRNSDSELVFLIRPEIIRN